MPRTIKQEIGDQIEFNFQDLPEEVFTQIDKANFILKFLNAGIPFLGDFANGVLSKVGMASVKIGLNYYTFKYTLKVLKPLTALQVYSQAKMYIEAQIDERKIDSLMGNHCIKALEQQFMKEVPISTDSLLPQASKAEGRITDVWVERAVHINALTGVKIHVGFTVYHLMNVDCTATARFYLLSGEKLRDTNGLYTTSDGQVAISAHFTPESNKLADYVPDLALFIPLREFHLPQKPHCLKCRIELYEGKSNKPFAQSNDYEIKI